MKDCFVEFTPKDADALQRANAMLLTIKTAKESRTRCDDAVLASFLTESERSYFWNPTPDEQEEWNDHWFSTPVDIRLSPNMVGPQWQFESMLDAFWNGDYDLAGILEVEGRHRLVFSPRGYPYGSIDCMVALLECFGHTVVGLDYGLGYEEYKPRTEYWRPQGKKRAQGNKPWRFWR